MADDRERDQRARDHHELLWQQGDPWDMETEMFEAAKFERQFQLLHDRRYGKAIEIGCGAGVFTAYLARLADRVLAIDIAASAIERARSRDLGPGVVEFRVANAMELDPAAAGPWDLIVLSETVYSLGWLYSTFELAWFGRQLFESTVVGGRLLMANTISQQEKDWLLRPWLIYTYRDMFANVGYTIQHEELLPGVKHGVAFETLMTCYTRAGSPTQ